MHRSAKRSALTPIFNSAIYVDIKNILYKKSLIRFITGTNVLKKRSPKWSCPNTGNPAAEVMQFWTLYSDSLPYA